MEVKKAFQRSQELLWVWRCETTISFVTFIAALSLTYHTDSRMLCHRLASNGSFFQLPRCPAAMFQVELITPHWKTRLHKSLQGSFGIKEVPISIYYTQYIWTAYWNYSVFWGVINYVLPSFMYFNTKNSVYTFCISSIICCWCGLIHTLIWSFLLEEAPLKWEGGDFSFFQSVFPFSPLFNYFPPCLLIEQGQRGHLFLDGSTQFPARPCFYCVKPGYSRRHQSKWFTLANPPSVLAWASANIRQNPPSAVPEDIGPRMKGLTDERKYIFALSVEFVSRGLAYLLEAAHHGRTNSL